MAQHQTRALGWIFVAYISAFVGVAAPLIHRSDAEDIERAIAKPIHMSILIARRFPESYLLDGRVLERVEDYGNSATYRELDVPDGSEMVVGWQTLRQAVQQWSTQ